MHFGIVMFDQVEALDFGAEYYPTTQRYGNFDTHPKLPAYVRHLS